jgi:hypothetical protein
LYKGSGHPKGGPIAIQRSSFIKKEVKEQSEPTIRTDFPENWIFDALDGDEFE